MSYDVRVVPPEAYSQLADTPLGPNLRADLDSLVVAGFDGPTPIGTWMCLNTYFLDGAWVREDHRGGRLASKIIHTMLGELESRGLPGVWTVTNEPNVQRMLVKPAMGFDPIPGQLFLKRF